MDEVGKPKPDMANTQARILCIDPDTVWLTTLATLLEKEGYQVETARDGLAGIEKACETIPDLIILEVDLVGLDGYRVCEYLKRDPATARIGILFLTAKGNVNEPVHEAWELAEKVKDRLKGFDAGALEFLSKPVTEQDLVQRVKALLWTAGDSTVGKIPDGKQSQENSGH